MPEFILDYGSIEGADRFKALDDFTQSYITCALWCGLDERDHVTFADLAPETLAAMIADCNRFRDDAKTVACIGDRHADAGHDFWLTRNCHGAGFWDGDWPDPDSGYLDLRASGFGSVDLDVIGGRIYA